MANVKITELTELSAADSNDADVFPIVDIDADATKKITIASLRTTVAAANDFVTFTRLNANVNIVQGNIAATVTESTAIEARRVANIAGAVSTITTGNLDTGRALISDGSGKVAVSPVTATEIGYVDGVTSAIQTQIDAKSSTTNSAAIVTEAVGIEARRVANVAGAVSTITDLNLTASRAVVSLANGKVGVSDVTSTEIGYLDGVSSALQTQLDTKIATTASASNDFVTYAQLNANINIVSANAAAVETKRVANIAGAVSTITTADLTASRALVSDGSGKVAISDVTSTELGYVDGVTSAIQTQLNAATARINSNAAVAASNTASVESRRVANIAGAVSTITTADLTASRAVVSDGSGKVAVSAVTATELGYVDGVTSAIQTQLNDINTRATANATSSGAADAVEVRRVANIAGAVSTITTLDLTASRAVVSLANGKVGVSAVTATELGYLDGVSSAIQTQIDTKSPLASPTFSGVVTAGHDLVVTGNLTVNGDTTTVNSENKIIQDRFIMLANAVSGAPSADVGIFFNRGNEGNAAIYYDESAKFFTLSETRDPDTNVAIFPTGAANLAVGHFTASSVKYNGADLNTAITDNRSGAVSTVYKDNLTASRAIVSDGSGKIAISDVTSTEIGYLDGVTSAIQTQINNTNSSLTDNSSRIAATVTETTAVEARRVANVAGAVSTITDLNLTASRAVVSLANGKVGVSAVTATELGYLDGVSSAIQTQLDTKIATTASASNDFITYTQLNANINLVQDNVVSASGGATGVEARRVANIAGAVSTITTGNLTASRAVVSDGSGKVAVSAVTSTELGYLDGVSSAIQTQINSKQATITGAATTIDDADLTASRAIVSDGSGKVAVSAVTSTEIGYLDGVSSAIQTQLNAATARINSNAAVAASNTASVEARRVANVAGAVSTITDLNLTASRAVVSLANGKVGVSAVTATEVGYLDGVSSAIQTQINSKQATITGAATTIDDADLTASRALVSDGSGKVAISAVTSTEIGYLDGVTSAIQTQLNAATARINSNAAVAASNTSSVESRRVANIAGAVSTITTGNLTASRALVSDGSGKVAALASVTSTELAFLDATSSVQTQLDTKIATTAAASNDFITFTRLDANVNVVSSNASAVETKRVANIAGAVSTITTGNLTASRAVVSDGSGKVAVSDVTATEVGYLDGVSSAIQTQLNAKQATLAGATLDLGTL